MLNVMIIQIPCQKIWIMTMGSWLSRKDKKCPRMSQSFEDFPWWKVCRSLKGYCCLCHNLPWLCHNQSPAKKRGPRRPRKNADSNVFLAWTQAKTWVKKFIPWMVHSSFSHCANYGAWPWQESHSFVALGFVLLHKMIQSYQLLHYASECYRHLWDQGPAKPLPWQTTQSHTTQFHLDIIHQVQCYFCQWWPISSPMPGHITLKDHIIIQELFKRSPVGFWKSTENWSRSGLQE